MPSDTKLDLRTIPLDMRKFKTIQNQHGANVDMYLVWQQDGEAITVGLPEGRDDVARFIQAALQAGQRVLAQLPPGIDFTPDLEKIKI